MGGGVRLALWLGVAAAACAGLMLIHALPAAASGTADPPLIKPSSQPKVLRGSGGRDLLVEGPFRIEWRSEGEVVAIKISSAAGASAMSTTTVQQVVQSTLRAGGLGQSSGSSQGLASVAGSGRYRVSITASDDWELTLAWPEAPPQSRRVN